MTVTDLDRKAAKISTLSSNNLDRYEYLTDKISKKNHETNKLLSEFRKIDETLDTVELVFKKTDGTRYEFNCFSFPLKFLEKIYNYKITLNEAIEKQAELGMLMNKLNSNYNPRLPKKVKDKKKI